MSSIRLNLTVMFWMEFVDTITDFEYGQVIVLDKMALWSGVKKEHPPSCQLRLCSSGDRRDLSDLNVESCNCSSSRGRQKVMKSSLDFGQHPHQFQIE
jgi:hypothetical protein